jgi:hypothetical protein
MSLVNVISVADDLRINKGADVVSGNYEVRLAKTSASVNVRFQNCLEPTLPERTFKVVDNEIMALNPKRMAAVAGLYNVVCRFNCVAARTTMPVPSPATRTPGKGREGVDAGSNAIDIV